MFVKKNPQVSDLNVKAESFNNAQAQNSSIMLTPEMNEIREKPLPERKIPRKSYYHLGELEKPRADEFKHSK